MYCISFLYLGEMGKGKKVMKTIDIKNLDFNPNDVGTVGKGVKTAALKDMGFHSTDFDNLEDLYTNEFFKDTPEWNGGDSALADVIEWEESEIGF